jgi:hypothetical protein
MISDSPYKVNEAALSPGAGILAGIFASALMLGVVWILQPVSGIPLASMVRPFATLILPHRFEQLPLGTLLLIGVLVHVLLRTILALLYAVCQQQVPLRGYIAVGTFFGFLIWVLGSVIAGRLLSGGGPNISRSWTWLLANLTFGLTLAATAVIVSYFRPASEAAVPKD